MKMALLFLAGYENQDFALAEIVEHQRTYIKVEK